MSEEQLETLERWIISLIRDEDRASGMSERIQRNALKRDVRVAFGLIDGAE